jgi:hypothetical protein
MDEAQIGEVGESPPFVHPISIPEQNEITQPLHLFICQRNSKKEGTLFINKTYYKTIGDEGSGNASLLHYHVQRSLPRGKIAIAQLEEKYKISYVICHFSSRISIIFFF